MRPGTAHKRTSARAVANLLYLVPPVATGLAVALTGETPGWLTLAGGALAIAGVALVNTLGRR
nr:EamA family transporter [Burkholderia sp. TSV86]